MLVEMQLHSQQAVSADFIQNIMVCRQSKAQWLVGLQQNAATVDGSIPKQRRSSFGFVENRIFDRVLYVC